VLSRAAREASPRALLHVLARKKFIKNFAWGW
jgi:hypothetical protein